MVRWLRLLGYALTGWRCLIVVAIATSGCAHNEPYPEKWAPTIGDLSLCAHIDGDYTPYDYGSRSVISWIGGKAIPSKEELGKPLAADRLNLRILDNTLTATAYLEGKIITQKQYDVQCGGDSLVLDLGRKFEAGQGVVGYSSYMLRLRKDSSGSIVVNENSSGIGAYGLLPIVGSTSTWVARFVPYDPSLNIPQETTEPSAKAPQCMYNISHIAVNTRGEAEKIEKALEKGENFDQLAATDNRFFLRLKKGQLGWVSPDWFPTLEATISHLRKGEYNHVPVEDKYGWHVIKVNDLRPDGCTTGTK